MQVNKLEHCETCLKAALAEDEGYAPALQLLAKLYMKNNRADEAIALLEKMAATSTKNLQTLVSLSSAYVETDQHEKAKATLNEALVLDADCQVAKDELGKIAFKEGDLPLATKFLAETENGDELARTFNNMAVALVAKSEFTKAIEIYNGAMRVLSNKAKLYLLQYNLGLAYRRHGDFENGFRSLARSYLSDPTFEKSYASLAKLAKEMTEKGKRLDAQLMQEIKKTRAQHPPVAVTAAPGERKTG